MYFKNNFWTTFIYILWQTFKLFSMFITLFTFGQAESQVSAGQLHDTAQYWIKRKQIKTAHTATHLVNFSRWSRAQVLLRFSLFRQIWNFELNWNCVKGLKKAWPKHDRVSLKNPLNCDYLLWKIGHYSALASTNQCFLYKTTFLW